MMVPPVVVKRRAVLHKDQPEDPALPILSKASRLSRKHTRDLTNLAIRSMGLVQSPDIVNERFDAKGLQAVKLDGRAKTLLSNAILKISEILIFKMAAEELVNDIELRERLVDLFVEQRFDMMKPKPPNNVPNTPVDQDAVRSQVESMMRSLMESAMGLG